MIFIYIHSVLFYFFTEILSASNLYSNQLQFLFVSFLVFNFL